MHQIEPQKTSPARMAVSRMLTKEDVRLAERLAREISNAFRERVCSIVIDRVPIRPGSNPVIAGKIPVVVILDDLTKPLPDNEVRNYLESLKKIIHLVSTKIHVSTIKLSEHWAYSRMAMPQHLDFLRYGVALYDRGFFGPMQSLVTKGRIRPTIESEGVYITRADSTIKNANNHILSASLDLYWAAIDASHAALMSIGCTPPEPADVASELDRNLVKPRLLEAEYARVMQMFYELSRGIMHKTVRNVSGEDYEHYYLQASKIVKRMEKIV